MVWHESQAFSEQQVNNFFKDFISPLAKIKQTQNLFFVRFNLSVIETLF